jgi:hypothetical protein
VAKKMYLVFMCPRCGSIRIAKESQKTAQCYECNNRVPINRRKIRILFKTVDKKEAIRAIQMLKMKRGIKGEGQRKLF